ncbi:hypothetical protein B5S33_g3719 [[Candida] boidinii]|nr:hypothetical protein B5S33_g3719 [[Candida] boidinii]
MRTVSTFRLCGSTFETYTYPIPESQSHEVELNRNLYPVYEELQSPIYDTNDNTQFDLSSKNFIRTLDWSSDGSHFVSINEDFGVRCFIVPQDIVSNEDLSKLVPFSRHFNRYPILCHKLPGAFSIYDEQNPLNRSIALSSRNMPIRLIDLKSKSSILDIKYEEMADNSLGFIYSMEFTKGVSDSLLLGSNKKMGIFNLEYKKLTRSINFKQLSILSTLTASSFDPNLVFAGSYNSSICIADIRTGNTVFQKPTRLEGSGIYQLLETQGSKYLFAVSRKSNKIKLLDIRKGMDELITFNWTEDTAFSANCVLTNQKLYGDLSPEKRKLIIGNSIGEINIFDSVDGSSNTGFKSSTNTSISNIKMNPLPGANLAIVSHGSRSDGDDGTNVSENICNAGDSLGDTTGTAPSSTPIEPTDFFGSVGIEIYDGIHL